MGITATHEFDIRTDCWGQAERRIAELTMDQVDALEAVLEDYFAGDIPSDVQINDIIAYDDSWEDWIGLSNDEEDEDDDFEESVKRPSRRLSRRLRSESTNRIKARRSRRSRRLEK